jgi:hypothetical protein
MGEIDNKIKEASLFYKDRGPSAQHTLSYDSSSEQLEPVYFWILDFMEKMFGGDIKKITDNFSSAAGGGHFAELGQRRTLMQQEASRILATINTILKSVINLIYDLKEFKIRLGQYDEAKSKDKNRREAGMLALKQIWMDKVDIQRGAGSINALASGSLQFVTLRDGFMAVNSAEEVDELDLNERVKRILKPRVQEFFQWAKTSEMELRKRFEIEKTYLKSQIDALKLQSRWAKPYLRAAEQLATHEKLDVHPAMVKVFNTMIVELTLMAKTPVNINEAIISGDLPPGFEKMKKLRKYYSVVVVDFFFRGIPSKAGQHYVFGGKADVSFKAYVLNEDELSLLDKKLTESDLGDALKLVEGMTEQSLGQLKIDLDEFLEPSAAAVKEKEEENPNPFTALLSIFRSIPAISKKKEKKEITDIKEIKSESYAERYIRNLAEANAINSCFAVYDTYKKSHGMAAFPYGGGEAAVKAPTSKAEELFGF